MDLLRNKDALASRTELRRPADSQRSALLCRSLGGKYLKAVPTSLVQPRPEFVCLTFTSLLPTFSGLVVNPLG